MSSSDPPNPKAPVFDVDPDEVTSEWDTLSEPALELADLYVERDNPDRFDPQSTLILAPWLGKQLASHAATLEHHDPTKPQPLDPLQLQRALDPLSKLSGFLAVYIGDLQTGEILACSSALNQPEQPLLHRAYAATFATHLQRLHVAGVQDALQDAIFTLENTYHLVRLSRHTHDLFLLLILNKKLANLGLARLRLAEAEHQIALRATSAP